MSFGTTELRRDERGVLVDDPRTKSVVLGLGRLPVDDVVKSLDSLAMVVHRTVPVGTFNEEAEVLVTI